MGINNPPDRIDALPTVVPVFPLASVLLLPRGELPLNIFEPRYLAMMEDALRSNRIIGMVQPQDEKSGMHPPIQSVGCLGKITQFAETGDGRFMITLTGLARFRVAEELTILTPYRQCVVSYAEFEHDLKERDGEELVDRSAVLKALRSFAEANRLKIDWKSIEQTPNEALVNALAMMSPFGPDEKQALLEAKTLAARADVLVAITEIELARGNGPSRQLQ
jgi:Lon protease-like protein